MPNTPPTDDRPRPNSATVAGQGARDEANTARPVPAITPEQMKAILVRARQTVKPIVNREATNEIVSEDILNFKMK